MKQVSAAECARVIDAGRSSASSSRSHSRAVSVANTLPAPLITAGTPSCVERLADQRRLAVGAHQHRQVARGPASAVGASRVRRALGPGCQQGDDVVGQIAGHVGAPAAGLHEAAGGQRHTGLVAADDADPHRRRVRRWGAQDP